MNWLNQLPLWLDPYMMVVYRLTGIAAIDYLIGTLLLAMFTVVLGEFTVSLTMLVNRRHLEKLENDMNANHALSLAAAQEKDRTSYKACNNQANDAFGKYFFNMVAYSAATLWPIPLALSWMQYRFNAVEFEWSFPIALVWHSTGYFTSFFLCYVLCRIVFKNARPYLPYFKRVQKILDALGDGMRRTTRSAVRAEGENGVSAT